MSTVPEPDGLLIRGADGHLWAVRPGTEPERLSPDANRRLTPMIEAENFKEASEELLRILGCIVFFHYIHLPWFGRERTEPR